MFSSSAGIRVVGMLTGTLDGHPEMRVEEDVP